jgi:Zn-dependent alcohol dehydrogenase
MNYRTIRPISRCSIRPNAVTRLSAEGIFPVFIRWYREGKLKLNDLVAYRYPLDQINTAVDDVEHGRILGPRKR